MVDKSDKVRIRISVHAFKTKGLGQTFYNLQHTLTIDIKEGKYGLLMSLKIF